MNNINNNILEMRANLKKIKNTINNNLVTFLTRAAELVEMSENMYQIEKTIKLNKISLKGYILDSQCCSSLKDNNISNYTIEELKVYLKKYEESTNIDCSSYYLALLLYENLEDIEKSFDKINDIELKFISQLDSSINNIGSIKKSEYETFYNKIKVNLTNNFLKQKIVSEDNFDIVIQILNDIFNFYISGYPDIPNEYIQNSI